MYKTLRILFTILSAICVAATIPVGTLLGFDFAVGAAIGAIAFFLIMLHFKQKQEELESSEKSDEPDFLNSDDSQPPKEN